MRLFNWGRKGGPSATETRASIENPSVPVGADGFLTFFGVNDANLPAITIDSALCVPSVWAAVAFLSRTLATLPIHAYRSSKDGPKRLGGKIETVIHDAPNDGMDSFKFRQYFWQQVFTGGRGLAWIERTPASLEAIWPIDPSKTTISKSPNGTLTYVVGGQTYDATEIIDVPFMLKADAAGHYGPIARASKAIQLALAMNDYASNFFAGGGVPPLALSGPMPAGPDAVKRAQQDIRRAIDAAKGSSEQVFPIPAGYDLKPVGFDPEKGQMTDARRFQIEEIARAYQLPPVFLQDLTHGTYSNTEQQGAILVKHLIGQWAKALEGEMTLKLFGRSGSSRYVEHNLDGLMRGDFATRMEGLSKAVQNALLTPNEARELENRPSRPNGDDLMIQGATVPMGQQKMQGAAANDNQQNEAQAA
ncbi:phage portal protein [Consotaella salsifontis]|uniref:Phage portal protein, HK97 family n=1 Tax=Consotaella salsifontis TaxID=1365950 RepID=A0A1T4SSC1_9HYPH|nr:phage portal protein [Consotaella salsifontis]SKA31056.1 phage portal protein, HK97 family [Consotaella salsifontis]